MTPWDVYRQYLLVFSSRRSLVCYLITQIESINSSLQMRADLELCKMTGVTPHCIFFMFHSRGETKITIAFYHFSNNGKLFSFSFSFRVWKNLIELDFKLWFLIFPRNPGLAWQAPGSPDWGVISQTQGWSRSGFQYTVDLWVRLSVNTCPPTPPSSLLQPAGIFVSN